MGQVGDQDDVTELTLGYVPKDVAFSLSQIVEAQHVFSQDVLTYDANLVKCQFGL